MAIQQVKIHDEKRREAWEKANPKDAAILKAIQDKGKASGDETTSKPFSTTTEDQKPPKSA